MKKKSISKHEVIKSLIKESDYSFKEIASQTNSHINTIYNINAGRTHFDQNEQYPLRSRDGDRVRKLIKKLSIPNSAAVPSIKLITPYLLEYISMLSFLKVDIDCLLLFKPIYLKDVSALVGDKPSDEQLVSLFRMQPQKPDKLKILLDAYYSPSLTLGILKYWEETGFLKKEETQDVFKIFLKI